MRSQIAFLLKHFDMIDIRNSAIHTHTLGFTLLWVYLEYHICKWFSSRNCKIQVKYHPQLIRSEFVESFFLLFVSVLPLEIQLSRGEGGNSITQLTQPHFCVCPKPGHGNPATFVCMFQARTWKPRHIFVYVPSQDMDFQNHMLSFFIY